METVNMGLGRPDASVGRPDAASIPDTRRWLTHEFCKARARRPSGPGRVQVGFGVGLPVVF